VFFSSRASAASAGAGWCSVETSSDDLEELAAAAWPQLAGAAWLDDDAKLRLLAAYIRRKQFEARLLAIELADLFGAGSAGAGGQQHIHASAMVAMIGGMQ
jgi:hypothetical protein